MDSGVIFWIIVGIIILFLLRRKRRERKGFDIRVALLGINYRRMDMEAHSISAMKFDQKLAKFSNDDLCDMFDSHYRNIKATKMMPIEGLKQLIGEEINQTKVATKVINQTKVAQRVEFTLLMMLDDIDNDRV